MAHQGCLYARLLAGHSADDREVNAAEYVQMSVKYERYSITE